MILKPETLVLYVVVCGIQADRTHARSHLYQPINGTEQMNALTRAWSRDRQTAVLTNGNVPRAPGFFFHFEGPQLDVVK